MGGLRESFAAAKATGYEPVPSTGDKALDKIITKRQQEGDVLVLPASPDNPSYISQLSKNPEAIERQREYLGLSQAASSSSSPAEFNISTPRTKPKAKSKRGDTGGSNEPKRSAYVAAIGESPDNVTYNKDGSPRKQRSDVGTTRTKK